MDIFNGDEPFVYGNAVNQRTGKGGFARARRTRNDDVLARQDRFVQKLGNIACGLKRRQRLVGGRGIARCIGRCTRKRTLCLQLLQRKCSLCVLADVDGQRFVDAGRWHHDLAPFAVRQEDGLDGAAGHVVVRRQRGSQGFQVRVGE